MFALGALLLLTGGGCASSASKQTAAPVEEPTRVTPENNETAQAGSRVRVHYKGTLDDGTEFDSSRGRDPLEFVVGSGQVITGFDEAVTGLKPGEKRTVHIPPEKAYGEYDKTKVFDVPRSEIPQEAVDQFIVGGKTMVPSRNGNPAMVATIVKISDGAVSFDANSDLAGKALNFEVELVEIAL
ncbi:MAG TPA: peptidylprolyl isomerase [Candidatus Magasanikbacteria bacterium]|nr:peptidylprolyl isomerase [Candidatus Magasanikbacteria bacterium]